MEEKSLSELRHDFEEICKDLDGRKTYWYVEEVKRDQTKADKLWERIVELAKEDDSII